MAFGITRAELNAWKSQIDKGEIAFLTHYWHDKRFPSIKTVTKVGCLDEQKLVQWCEKYGLNHLYIHRRTKYPHFDLIGPRQYEILLKEGLEDHAKRFRLSIDLD